MLVNTRKCYKKHRLVIDNKDNSISSPYLFIFLSDEVHSNQQIAFNANLKTVEKMAKFTIKE